MEPNEPHTAPTARPRVAASISIDGGALVDDLKATRDAEAAIDGVGEWLGTYRAALHLGRKLIAEESGVSEARLAAIEGDSTASASEAVAILEWIEGHAKSNGHI